MNFLAYDVETANSYDIGSICAVGWAYIEDDEVTAHGYSLINPETPFTERNIQIHGIQACDVCNSPTFAEYWESTLCDYMANTIVVAHGAGFDIAATEQALKNAGMEDPGIDYFDFLPICRKLLPELEHHGLSALAEWAGYHFQHHNAEADALAIVDIAHAICAHYGYAGISELVIRTNTRIDNSLANSFEPISLSERTGFRHFNKPIHVSTESVVIKDHLLEGYVCCITGDIPGYDRESVERFIISHGGICKAGISRKINCLIVGEYHGYPLNYISSKHQKVLNLIADGADILIFNGQQFLEILDSDCACNIPPRSEMKRLAK